MFVLGNLLWDSLIFGFKLEATPSGDPNNDPFHGKAPGADVIKLFTHVIFECLKKARM